MDTDDRALLQAQLAWLEYELLAVERALENRTHAIGDVELRQLTATQERRLTQLADVNIRLSALRGSAAPT